jgi:hypothetical protein
MSETEKVTTETTSETVAAPVTTDPSQAKEQVEVSETTTTVEKSDG